MELAAGEDLPAGLIKGGYSSLDNALEGLRTSGSGTSKRLFFSWLRGEFTHEP